MVLIYQVNKIRKQNYNDIVSVEFLILLLLNKYK